MKTLNEKIKDFLITGKLKLKGDRHGLLSDKTIDRVTSNLFLIADTKETHLRTIDRLVTVTVTDSQGVDKLIGFIEVY